MHTLVSFIGDFSVDESKRAVSQVEFLENQPPLKIDANFANGSPEVSRRKILVYKAEMIKYHVIDVGRTRNAPEALPLGSQVYTEYDVERMRR